MDIREFLVEYSEETLKILHGTLYTLHFGSVDQLLKLMKSKNVEKLEGPNGWKLCINGTYYNKFAKFVKNGHAKGNPGQVFEGQNTYLNPFYISRRKTPSFRYGDIRRSPLGESSFLFVKNNRYHRYI
ncbi:hypothetical protein ACOALA_20505 (plasmid) [Alicyclobacillus acidoterrestris]|uniref:hypothetical protein n=1 Tax=Alicyclobacillus acidoterrestris TaxID=1450 RepID=UPI003F53CF74